MTTAPKIVAIHGAPRSGTSWLGQIFNSSPQVAYRYQPFFSYAFRDRVNSTSSQEELETFFSDLLGTQDDFVLQRNEARLAQRETRFRKTAATHLVYKEVRFHDLLPQLLERLPELRAIGLVRDPRAVIASWARAPREFQADWELDEEWRNAPLKNADQNENWYGFTRWKELASMFLLLVRRHPRRFRIVRYQDLVAAPKEEVDRIFQFCNIPSDAQIADFLDQSTSGDDHDPYGVYRKHGGAASKYVLSSDIAEQIETEVTGTPLAQFLDKTL